MSDQRFVRARWQTNLIFAGYDQDAWVAAQNYRGSSWLDLLDLWRSYNLHLARVMRAYPAESRLAEHREHNLDQIAWRAVPSDLPVSLDYFMADYVAHLRHHVEQLAALDLEGAASAEISWDA